MSAFKDHFSQVADAYAQCRPTYPAALFDVLSAVVPAHAPVWEPGCGSGQATRDLARRFAHVFATDPSAAQIEQHWAARSGATNVSVAVEPGESTSLQSDSVGLVAVAQALHWFDRARFFAECDRVLRPGGVLAAWTYQDMVFSDDRSVPTSTQAMHTTTGRLHPWMHRCSGSAPNGACHSYSVILAACRPPRAAATPAATTRWPNMVRSCMRRGASRVSCVPCAGRW